MNDTNEDATLNSAAHYFREKLVVCQSCESNVQSYMRLLKPNLKIMMSDAGNYSSPLWKRHEMGELGGEFNQDPAIDIGTVAPMVVSSTTTLGALDVGFSMSEF